MLFSTSICHRRVTLTLATCFVLATDAPGQLLERPAADSPSHLERPDQPPSPFIGPRQVSPPPSCEFLTVNGFTSVQVNVDEDGNNIIDDAANETTIAINPLDPDNIVIGWRQFDTIESNFRQSGVASSHDGGMTWTNRGPLQAGTFGSDPTLDVDADGVFYYVGIDFDEVRLFRSFNGGVDWDPAIQVIGGFRDKEWLTIDRTDGIGRGNLYMTWSNDLGFTRSTDDGMTWMTPIRLPDRAFWGTMSVGLDGYLYAVDYATGIVSRSTDAQDPDVTPTFEVVAHVDFGDSDDPDGADPNPGGLLRQPWISTDHSNGPTRGNVYLAQSFYVAGPDPMDFLIARSTDGGITWSDAVRINDDDPDPDAWQWFGTMDVAPSGRIDAVWYDTRNTGESILSEVFYAYSIDAGDTWSPNIQVAPMFDSTIGWPQQNKIGDYIGMISNSAAANVAYAATYNGEQDVYFLRIAMDCNQNGIHDGDDILAGRSEDCNGNAVPDECEPDEDCNDNGMRDLCEPDEGDCNDNDVPDECDIRDGTSEDCDENGTPDECDPDCNENGAPDECDIRGGISPDCNETGIPDECETLDGYDIFPVFPNNNVTMSNFIGFPSEEITVSLWINARDVHESPTVFSYAVPDQDDEFLIQHRTTLALEINGTSIETGDHVLDQQWHHIAFTWAAADGTFRFYLDGVQRRAGLLSPSHELRPDGTLVLAQDQDFVGGGFDPDEAFGGNLDELRIWNVVRSESEIRRDMSRRLIGDEPGLVGYWRFDEGEGRDAKDSTGHNNAVLNFERWREHVGVDVCPCFREPVWICDGDVDGDGQVNPVDSGLVQAAFGSVDGQNLCNYDVDCDGQINAVDAGIVQSLFGTCETPRAVCP